jgi:glycosyltransferase involved in cell wall biosynthesis
VVAIDAYAAYGDDRPPLVVAGPLRTARPALEERARAAGVAGSIRWAGFQTSEGLVDLYRGAIAYVDPSLYEGFGLQAAEALACGTPVIASNTTSLPEVVGDAGILVDPHDIAGFAAAMRRIVTDEAFAGDLRAKALVQARKFTWKQTARALLEACSQAVKRS